MDIIIIGKKHHNRLIKPHVIYCGQSREEAAAAVAATEGRFVYLYQVNPEPMIPVRTPEPSAAVLAERAEKEAREAELQAEAAAAANPPAETQTVNPEAAPASAPVETNDSAGADSPQGDEPAPDLTDGAAPKAEAAKPMTRAEKKAAKQAAKQAAAAAKKARQNQ